MRIDKRPHSELQFVQLERSKYAVALLKANGDLVEVLMTISNPEGVSLKSVWASAWCVYLRVSLALSNHLAILHSALGVDVEAFYLDFPNSLGAQLDALEQDAVEVDFEEHLPFEG